MASFDVIVVGAGPAGEVVSGLLARRGHEVAIVESGLVGGECAFYACMPSKALLRPAEALAEVRRVPGAAQAASGELDVAAVLARRDEVIHHLDDSTQLPWLEERGITLIRGHARLDGERFVRVGGERHEARRAVVIATGSAAAIPPIEGLADAAPWTNREVTTSAAIPPRLLVLGGGVVGVEMAQAYSELGSSVCVLEAGDRLIAKEEDFAAKELQQAFEERGIDVRLGVEVKRVERNGATVTVTLSDGSTVEGEEILVAVGRRPLTGDLGLETVGLEPGKPIDVDERLAVPGIPWLYAVGDVNQRALFTHAGKYQARIAAIAIDGGGGELTSDPRGVPRVVFTDPEIAAVGLTLELARESASNVRAYDVASDATAGASFHGRGSGGTSRIVVDEDRGVIVGATFTGSEVAEWLHAATIAVTAEIPLARLWEALPVFPTRSEVWLRLLERREQELRLVSPVAG
jgi:pyruvate/2-oxoglutarate dehydrogenase complex dihydrolipoamide dehydrogenase (E3) component